MRFRMFTGSTYELTAGMADERRFPGMRFGGSVRMVGVSADPVKCDTLDVSLVVPGFPALLVSQERWKLTSPDTPAAATTVRRRFDEMLQVDVRRAEVCAYLWSFGRLREMSSGVFRGGEAIQPDGSRCVVEVLLAPAESAGLASLADGTSVTFPTEM